MRFDRALVPSFINSVSIPEPRRAGEKRERRTKKEPNKKGGKKVKIKTEEKFERLYTHLNPAVGALFLAAEAVEPGTHTPKTHLHTHTHTPLLAHAAQTPNKQGPVPHQWLKRRGAQLTLVPRRGRANAASSPLPPPSSLLSPARPSAAAAAAFIVPAPSARHLTFHSSNAWPSPGLRVTALVYSSDLTNLAGRG